MTMNTQKNMDGYNKHINESHGTLIGNWFEEEILRNKTGEGRTIAGQHVEKTRAELFDRPPEEFNFTLPPTNNSFNRTMPDFRVQKFEPHNKEYGTYNDRVSK